MLTTQVPSTEPRVSETSHMVTFHETSQWMYACVSAFFFANGKDAQGYAGTRVSLEFKRATKGG